MALDDSRLSLGAEDPLRVAVIFGTGIGGMETIIEEHKKFLAGCRVTPFFVPKLLTSMAAGQISIRYGIKGPVVTTTTACASGADAVGVAMRLLKSGDADVALAGGAESLFNPLLCAGLCSARALSTRNDEPQKASRPFDLERDGFVLGEGGGGLVLETLEHASRRHASILAELVGFGSCGEGYHITAPSPDGRGEAHCMRQALASAGMQPEEIDYINAHGTSTPLGDKIETLAIKRVFGRHAYRVPVSSTKGATGHLIGAGGATELIACILAIREGIVPPTINLTTPDPECDLDYVPNTARPEEVRAAMSNSFGFGGQNASLIVRRFG
jgi:3-oxoacyl-[acyl-carrier-protein] synthase II